ncbi:hypothetical protein BGZ57DRAFT_877002 [Hyaloscypha finlandica]|nr:hypothetical protein BGZ57DRAFT_877002 [Hyaloscypha finlandica]KAH8806325.1 hypothetical protein F5882DRAFT_456616 [Hyaloscypha sp. PMI_1271]
MTADSRLSQNPRPGKDVSSTTQNAALRGASLAFGKPPVKPKPQINNYSGDDWALAAATKVGGASLHQQGRYASGTRQDAPGDGQSLSHQNTGSSVGGQSYMGGSERPNIQQRISQLGGTGFLQPPGGTADHSKSPSFIAATLAASRSASVSPNPTGQRQPHWEGSSGLGPRAPSARSGGSSSRESIDQPLDTTSIPPTTSLIGMFEQTATSPSSFNRPPGRRSATSASRRPPGPPRTASPPPARTLTPSPMPAKPRKPEIKSLKPTLTQVSRQRVQSDPPPVAAKPTLPASKPIPTANDEDDASSDDSFVSASDYKPSFRASLNQQNRRLTSTSKASVDSEVATIDSLANAIVASSIASSRAASPSRNLAHQQSLYPPPPPPSRRNNHSGRGYLFQPIIKELSRTPSPAKQVGLRTTMRKPKSKEELDDGERKRGRRNLMKKHPHKHHEGDRKRWRDSITERERKRYEAVWASNKGLFMSGSDEGEEYTVCSLVVRDIFSRSRLHVDVLEEVYTLVDRSRNGRLEREEFVVGLWLIDQRLKGRKLPIKVSDSVWKSVGVLGGIKVKKAGK